MAQIEWDKQFKKSLERSGSEESGDRQYLTHPITTGFEPLSDSEDSRLFSLAHNALAHQYFEKSLRHLEHLVHPCESPIEKAMLYALCILAHEYASHVRYKVKDYEFGDYERATAASAWFRSLICELKVQ
jgi:hypothetical protein